MTAGRIARAVACCAALALPAAACTHEHSPVAGLNDRNMLAAGEYVLQPGDRIEIRPVLDAAYAVVAVVGPDGTILVPGIKTPVTAAGNTVAGLTGTLQQGYRSSGVLRDPLFTVNLLEIANSEAFVAGEVLRPGPVPVGGSPRSLLQAIMARGGPLATAKLSDVGIIRVMPDGQLRLFAADLSQVLSGADLTRNATLRPMDIVIVPKTQIAQVDVWVDQYVRRAAPIPLSLAFRLTNQPTLVPTP